MSSHRIFHLAHSLRVLTSLLLAVAALVLVLQAGPTANAGEGTPPATRTGSGSVTIFNLAFNPSVITITTGSSVEWTNTDPFTHTTTSDIDLWSQILGPGAVFSTTFAAPGEYTYHCAIHPFMHGQVVVLTSVYLPVIMRL